MKEQTPRGIRNNNPGNLDYSPANKWQGLVADGQRSDKRFCEFKDAVWGIRAMAVLIVNYQDKYGLRTVRGIVNRWAPPNENDTLAYVNSVCDSSHFTRDEILDLHSYDHLRPIIEAIIHHENGYGPKANINSWYDDAVIDEALKRAGVVRTAATVSNVPVTKETAAATGTAAIGVAQLADVAPQIMQVIDGQQAHLSSGSYTRIAIGLATIGLALVIAYSQVKKHQTGVLA